ncbi:MAG: uroporphyrinogen decarboxylase [Candidatus Accumulibacter sp.]|nr:uroporphyrinogen decarboxylase [Accumulibacter sp.]
MKKDGDIFRFASNEFSEKSAARLSNDSFLRALFKEETAYTPIWLMRQAGRYLPEYRALRERVGSFARLYKDPELSCEVALFPLARFPLDAAIVFSDILTIPDAMGLGLSFIENEGPKFEYPLRDERAIRELFVPDPFDRLRYLADAVSTTRHALAGRVPLIGFTGSPYTLACYMIEGGISKDYRFVKTMIYDRPDLMHHILDVVADAALSCLNAQIESGAQVAMIFDSCGGVLSTAAFREFSLPYTRRVVAGLIKEKEGERIPSIIFTKGGGAWLESIADTGCASLGLDWMTDLGEARRRVGGKVSLQGNLDPQALFAAPDRVAVEAVKVIDSYGPDATGLVFNLGHGVSQFTPPEHVAALVEAVHRYTRKPKSTKKTR